MPEPVGALVAASDDAVDQSVPDEILQIWTDAELSKRARILRALKREDRWWQERERDEEQMRAAHAARSTEIALRAELQQRGEDWSWDSKYALDLQDFTYLFLHRKRFGKRIKTWLEVVNAKITHTCRNGDDGYFKKLERNIGWTRYITPIIFALVSITDKLVRCGIWSNAKNSRRCHQRDFCALCLWNDVLKALVYAFGRRSCAFERAGAWWFITIGWTVNRANMRCRCDEYDPDEHRPHARDRNYDPYPVVLGLGDDDPDLPFLGYEDARILGVVMQWAIGELYHRGHINGYHLRHEGEFRLNPGGTNRVNFHNHTVANGDDTNGQFIAQKLYEFLHEGWTMFGPDRLNRDYYPDILIQRITSPEHLEHAVVYGEKVVPIAHAVADALARPEARSADGFFDARYVANLKTSLARLIDDDIPSIFTGARLDDEQPRLFRRRTVGNMQFNDHGTCIGSEPSWHIEKRRNAAKRTKESRKRRKASEQESGRSKQSVKRHRPRRRKGQRRLPRVQSAQSPRPSAGVDKSLIGEVEQVHGFDFGAALDLDDVPRAAADRVQDVNAGEATTMDETGLEQRLPQLDSLQ